jgi:hypothetical protein
MKTGPTSPKVGPAKSNGAGRRSHGSGATIISTMDCLLWGAIKDKARSERCEG